MATVNKKHAATVSNQDFNTWKLRPHDVAFLYFKTIYAVPDLPFMHFYGTHINVF